MSKHCTPLLSPELYALEVSPIMAACVFLLWWSNYVGGLVGFVGPWSGWLLGTTCAEASGWVLVVRTVSGGGLLQKPGWG